MKTSVFIIEDNPMYSMYVTLKLDDLFNYTTHLFHSAEEALENMHLKPDIFVMDYMLPGINGLDALRKIKKISPSTGVIIMSVQSDTAIVADVLHAGAYTYIVKNKDAGAKIIDSIVAISSSKK